jgi:branched-chain amino acid transport system ATP-binding protein
LTAQYGDTRVLHGVDFVLQPGRILALLGANGAGKTTTLRAICQSVMCAGEVRWQGQSLMHQPTEALAAMGLAHVPQGRGTLGSLTVEENLVLGAWSRHASRSEVQADMALWFERFPQLALRRGQRAGDLSGGEQQMLALARAMMMRPQLLVLDEPSGGLAPKVVAQVYGGLRELNRTEGLTILLVEQSAALALTLAHDAVVLSHGRVVCAGEASVVQHDPALTRAYLGGEAHAG